MSRKKKAADNRAANSALLAGYAANPSTIPDPNGHLTGAAANRQRNSALMAGYAANPASIPGAPQPPAPGPGPQDVGGRPLDWQEEAYGLGARRNVALSNAYTAFQGGRLDQEYGYGEGGAANPYSRAALLEESYKRNKAGTTNSMASAGQLYSGAYGRAQNENQRNYSIASDQNRRAYDDARFGLTYGQAQTAANYGVGVDDATFAALIRALGGGS